MASAGGSARKCRAGAGRERGGSRSGSGLRFEVVPDPGDHGIEAGGVASPPVEPGAVGADPEPVVLAAGALGRGRGLIRGGGPEEPVAAQAPGVGAEPATKGEAVDHFEELLVGVGGPHPCATYLARH